MSCMALNCSFEHLAYMLYLLFQIIWPFRILIDRLLVIFILDSKAAKARSCDFDLMVRIIGSKAVEAQC
jgi:hypothetical protein